MRLLQCSLGCVENRYFHLLHLLHWILIPCYVLNHMSFEFLNKIFFKGPSNSFCPINSKVPAKFPTYHDIAVNDCLRIVICTSVNREEKNKGSLDTVNDAFENGLLSHSCVVKENNSPKYGHVSNLTIFNVDILITNIDIKNCFNVL